MIATTDVGCKNLFVYAENNPVVFKDSTGNFLDTIFDIASLVGSIVDVCKHPTDPWAWAGLAGDALDLIPDVTGVGEGTKALSATAKGSKYIDDVIDGGLDVASDATESVLEAGIKRGRYSVGNATFMDANDAFVSNISRRTDVDANGYFDVVAHGTSNGIQITHDGQRMIVDHRTAARLIQNSDGYNGQAIRLLSCNTGALDNGFAQNLANKLNVEVYAPTNYLWATSNGSYFVAGMNNLGMPDMYDMGTFKSFFPGGN